ncbi:high affinity immunoglobulin epsilon receptor subunit beta isoform X1 [Choloepus didactylus]|uniref:high affinity immunoglobulin epsilon receptor subunit beta isoform X1 n=1 Tax=Choloepus didactylus TaxID=27675 RepID=UPI00189CF652|nr:high affinity immunoglobulin epsilon receptor subunit beta isoform X1 [Choloepus didactylus]
MDPENISRADLVLPNPEEPSSIELSEIAPQDETIQEKVALSPPQRTWLTFLKKELEFLGVTQILIGLICLCFGTIVYSMLNISEYEPALFSSFKAGYPFWGALFFAISGLLSIISEKKHATYLARGSLGANMVSSVVAATGIVILIINLKGSSAFAYKCQEFYRVGVCFVVSFSIEIVAMILFLTILGLCSAVSLTIYGVGEIVEGNKIPEERLYEELNIYSPIYSQLEDIREESSPPTD